MAEPAMTIGADGVDVDALVERIRKRVEERRNQGFYDEASVARAERYNLSNLADDEQFLERYLSCLRQAVVVDINDFEIVERRARFAPLLKSSRRRSGRSSASTPTVFGRSRTR
jgi:hypothetical protein